MQEASGEQATREPRARRGARLSGVTVYGLAPRRRRSGAASMRRRGARESGRVPGARQFTSPRVCEAEKENSSLRAGFIAAWKAPAANVRGKAAEAGSREAGGQQS